MVVVACWSFDHGSTERIEIRASLSRRRDAVRKEWVFLSFSFVPGRYIFSVRDGSGMRVPGVDCVITCRFVDAPQSSPWFSQFPCLCEISAKSFDACACALLSSPPRPNPCPAFLPSVALVRPCARRRRRRRQPPPSIFNTLATWPTPPRHDFPTRGQTLAPFRSARSAKNIQQRRLWASSC